MPPLVTFIGILLAVYVLAECVNIFIVGSSLTRSVFRVARQVLHGSKEVALTEDLKIAVTNGLLSVGSEVVVGTEHQWDGVKVRRFAISPSIVRADEGAIMQIVRLTRSSMELRPLANCEYAAIPRNQPDKVETRNPH